jgi:hypothetical protein
MRKPVSRILFWLAILSIASSHELILGLGTFVIAMTFLVLLVLSPFILAFGGWLLWYRVSHGRLPGWFTPDRLPGWLVGLTPRRMRRRARRRQPRPPRPNEAPTAEMAVVDPSAVAASPAGQLAGDAAGAHLP